MKETIMGIIPICTKRHTLSAHISPPPPPALFSFSFSIHLSNRLKFNHIILIAEVHAEQAISNLVVQQFRSCLRMSISKDPTWSIHQTFKDTHFQHRTGNILGSLWVFLYVHLCMCVIMEFIHSIPQIPWNEQQEEKKNTRPILDCFTRSNDMFHHMNMQCLRLTCSTIPQSCSIFSISKYSTFYIGRFRLLELDYGAILEFVILVVAFSIAKCSYFTRFFFIFVFVLCHCCEQNYNKHWLLLICCIPPCYSRAVKSTSFSVTTTIGAAAAEIHQYQAQRTREMSISCVRFLSTVSPYQSQ